MKDFKRDTWLMGLRKLGFKLDDKLRRMHPMKREQLHDELLRPRTEVDQVKIGDKWYSRTKVYKTLEKIAQEKTAEKVTKKDMHEAAAK